MIHVTPANKHYTRCNQDCDELQSLLSDLQRKESHRDYLAHVDGDVRSLADWTMEYYGIRRIRDVVRDKATAERHLRDLYKRLRDLAAMPTIKVKARQFRARTYMPNGQQVESWLPKGEYRPGSVVKLYVDRDHKEMADAREMLSDREGKWYIGETVYQQHIA